MPDAKAPMPEERRMAAWVGKALLIQGKVTSTENGHLLGDGNSDSVPPTGRDTATAAISALAAAAGAYCVRVHDVRGSLDAVRVAAAWNGARPQETVPESRTRADRPLA